MNRIFATIGLISVLVQQVNAGEHPKLIVAILVDQLRYDYLEKFQEQFTTNGFRLFLDRGVFMSSGRYNYVPTITAPGHASFLSGSTPAQHGIIGNDWLDRQTRKNVYCVGDSSVDGVGTTGEAKVSPRNFIGSNFADQLRLHYKSKVISISLKDRGAILPGGKKPAGAFWFESKSGNFVTSSYYTWALPNWVQEFNERKRPASFIGKKWNRLLDSKDYFERDNAAGEGRLAGETNSTFPHKIIAAKEGYDPILPTPFGNEILLELAEAAIDGEGLGQGPQPDLLCVSFSSIDYCGHTFGPYSQEVQDITLRFDRQLDQLFNYLDRRIGLTNVMMVLTADHGVGPTAQFAAAQGLESKQLNEGEFMTNLVTQLEKQFGSGKYFAENKIYGGNIYLNHPVLQTKGLSPDQVTKFIREAALNSGFAQACYSRDQLLEGRVAGFPGPLVLAGYNAERGGDLFLVLKPFVIPGGKTGTTHGSPYSYDTRVPILFYGSGFKPGRYADPFYITDIVPTFCASLHMDEPAQNIGKPFLKILAAP